MPSSNLVGEYSINSESSVNYKGDFPIWGVEDFLGLRELGTYDLEFC
jgi:hypothetical protein